MHSATRSNHNLLQALHVAVIARAHDAVRTLITAGFPLDVKNSRGWYALDEAISLGDRTAVETLFVAQKEAFKALLKEKKLQLTETLRTMPDCTMQVKWELGSPLFGVILRRMAPHDTYTIWKYKSLLRVDGSLMGIKDAQGMEDDDDTQVRRSAVSIHTSCVMQS